MSTPAELVTPALLRQWELPAPGRSKHSRGHVVVIGGSRSTPGALMLAGVAALRVGAGVLALVAPASVAIPLAVSVPESAVHSYDDRDDRDDPDARDADVTCSNGLDELLADADAVLLGPGIDAAAVAARLLVHLAAVDLRATPVVLDAFALGVLAGDPTLRPATSGRIVLSPNRQEAARLLEQDEDDLDANDVRVATKLAHRWSAVVTYQSVIADPSGRSWLVPTGHAGLGTSGSGDVLAGTLAGLLARGADVCQAAVWGTYLHAAAGDTLAPRVGRLGFLARELLDQLPAVLTQLQA